MLVASKTARREIHVHISTCTKENMKSWAGCRRESILIWTLLSSPISAKVLLSASQGSSGRLWTLLFSPISAKVLLLANQGSFQVDSVGNHGTQVHDSRTKPCIQNSSYRMTRWDCVELNVLGHTIDVQSNTRVRAECAWPHH